MCVQTIQCICLQKVVLTSESFKETIKTDSNFSSGEGGIIRGHLAWRDIMCAYFFFFLTAAVIRVYKIPYYKFDCKTGGKFHGKLLPTVFSTVLHFCFKL